jgi:hypothetical protein
MGCGGSCMGGDQVERRLPSETKAFEHLVCLCLKLSPPSPLERWGLATAKRASQTCFDRIHRSSVNKLNNSIGSLVDLEIEIMAAAELETAMHRRRCVQEVRLEIEEYVASIPGMVQTISDKIIKDALARYLSQEIPGHPRTLDALDEDARRVARSLFGTGAVRDGYVSDRTDRSEPVYVNRSSGYRIGIRPLDRAIGFQHGRSGYYKYRGYCVLPRVKWISPTPDLLDN